MVYVRLPKCVEMRVESSPYIWKVNKMANRQEKAVHEPLLPTKEKAVDHKLVITKGRVRNHKGIIHLSINQSIQAALPQYNVKKPGLSAMAAIPSNLVFPSRKSNLLTPFPSCFSLEE